MTDVEIYKRLQAEKPWTWRRFAEDGRPLESEPRDGGFDKLAECVAAVLKKFPDAEIRGIGGDEPEAKRLKYPGKERHGR